MKWMFGSLFLVILPLLILAPIAEAATLYFDPHESELRPGDTISVAVRIDTDDEECINVVDGIVEYPDSIVPVDVSLGESILPVWVESPAINTDSKTITFAGGIPNGYCGRIEGDPRLTNVILELIFQTSNQFETSESLESLAHLDFAAGTKVLLNDGLGTPTNLKTIGANILVFDEPGETVVNEWKRVIDEDQTPPREFSITLSSDESIYNGAYFIVFNTTDKQSGIDHYEVIEEPLDQINLFSWGRADAPWIRAKSPYKLEDQSLNSTIRVRAVDKAGNEYIAVYVPEEAARGLSSRWVLVVALGGLGLLVLLVLVGSILFYRRRVNQLDSVAEFTHEQSDQSEDSNLPT